MEPSRQGQNRPRPLRIAFLVQDGEHAQLSLDGIFADCYSRWGGRFSLIVPCSNNKIPENYWDWLSAFDPDIVYSYVPLGNNDVLGLQEHLNPSLYELHRHHGEPRLDVFGFSPRYTPTLLSSLSTIFRLVRQPALGQPMNPLSIVDSWHTENASRFLMDNFGTYRTSFATGIYPPDALAAADLLTVVAPEKLADNRFGIPRDLVTCPSELAAFEAIADRKAISLALLSARLASKLEVHTPGWDSSFNLVVGESFHDRILFWNARLHIPNWLDGGYSCLRITAEQLADDDFVAKLVRFLNNHNHVNNATGGQHLLAIRSTSASQEELDGWMAKLRAAKCWNISTAQRIGDLDALIPTTRSLEHAEEGHRLGGGFNLGPDWNEFRFAPPIAHPPSNIPDHLQDAPPKQLFVNGFWATDYLLQTDGPQPRFANANYWILPRRWRTSNAFAATFGRGPDQLVFQSRTNRAGRLTQFESLNRPLLSIQVPDGTQAIQYALCQDGSIWQQHGDPEKATYPLPRAKWMSPSNEARYLSGVLGLAGQLTDAIRFFLHPFLRNIMSDLGGTPALPADKVAPTVARLQKRAARNAQFDLRDGRERQALGSLIVKAANSLKRPDEYIKYSDLQSKWDSYRQEFWKKNPGVDKSGDVDWDEHERRALDTCLTEMRRNQILFQGHRWTCPECHNRNWVDIADLDILLGCTICRHEMDAPITMEWLFRPNEFLIEALRDHSVLSLLWVLAAFRERSRTSCVYTGPTWFWFDNPDGPPEAEADLLICSDGRTILCEAKSSWTGLRLQDIDALEELAFKLNPDVALLAIMDTGAGPTQKIEESKKRLSEANIELQVMTLETNPLRDDPYIH